MTTCRVCTSCMRDDGQQPRPRGGVLHYITCTNEECPMHGHTLTVEGYRELDLSPYLVPRYTGFNPPRRVKADP